MALKLNLVLVEACKVNRMVNSFFLTLETIYCFFAQPMNQEAFKKSFLPLQKVLTEISQSSNRKFIEDAGLLNVLKSARFCICLFIFHDVLRTIHVVYKSLQAGDITLLSAKTCVENMIHVFKTMRTGAKLG